MQNTKLTSILNYSSAPLKADNTVAEALSIMHKNHISSVVITNTLEQPIGIFTEHDALKLIANIQTKETPLLNVMSKNVFFVQENIYIHDAYVLMEQKKFRHLIVVNGDNRYLGIVTEGDFLRNMGFDEISKAKCIEDAISSSCLTVNPATTLTQAAKLMSESKCDYAIILDNNQPIGILNERDITDFCSTAPAIQEQNISVLQKHPMQFIKKSTSLQEASALMKKNGVHQLVVVDNHKNLIGLVSRHDILKALHGAYFEFLLQTIERKSSNEQLLKKHKKELEKKTVFLNSVVNTIPDLIWLKDRDGKYLICNTAYEKFLGTKQKDILKKTDFDFVEKALAEHFSKTDKQAIQEGGFKQTDEFLTFAEGSREGYFDTIKTPLKDSDEELIGILGIAYDVTQRKAKEEELEKLANYDPLTNLPNRLLFKTHLRKSVAKAIRNKHIVAVIIFDLDRFKDINDSYGHTIGDELLKIITSRLLSRVREGDVVARLGGDEFAVILEHITHEDDVARVTDEILECISSACRLSNGVDVHINSSAGVVIAPRDGQNVEELFQHADSALYRAKNDGRGTYRYYTDEMTRIAQEKIAYENKLRNALANNEMEVYYQPQVHIHTGRIVGAEALLRWNDPQKGIISPSIFIPIAEDTGLINSIGEWVLNETCRQGKIWLDKGYRLTLAVNVSANQVKYQNIPQMVSNALRKSGYSADKLELEITESALMQREEEVVAMLHTLRAKGIRLAIDDFGTGYSSLSYLKRFPIDVLKIDKSFIDDIPYEKDDMAIVVAIIEMGKALGYQILAEGIEHKEQLEFLKEKGCTYYQGYIKSKPLQAAAFETLFLEQNS